MNAPLKVSIHREDKKRSYEHEYPNSYFLSHLFIIKIHKNTSHMRQCNKCS